VNQLVALIREFMPDVVITHPEHGLYPHPDHLAVRELVREAFAAAADPRQLTGAGKAWPVARLFAPVIPQSFFDAEPVFGEQRVELGGQRLAFAPTPDDQVAVIMRTTGTADRRMAAWECHRSQHNPNGAFAHLPENRRRWLAENEHFVLDLDRAQVATAGGPPDGGPPNGGNLLAGLESWPGDSDADSSLTAALRGCLAARQAYLEIYHQYAAAEPKPQFRALLHSLAEREQEFLYVLAGALRQMDEIPGSIGKDERLKARARGCRTARSQSQFLLTAARHAVLRYTELASMPGDDSSGALWEQLQHLAEESVGAITEYTLLEQGPA